jgi:hypothetical protein
MTATPTSGASYSSAVSTLVVPSAAPTNVSGTVAAPAAGHVNPAAQQSRGKGGPGRLAGVDKESSDAINVIILQAILAEKRMVNAFLGNKAGSKMTKKDAMNNLMRGLGKHSNPVVRNLSTSALNKRIQNAVDAAKDLALSSDREKLAKLKDNVNEKNADAGNNLDAYDKCILELAIEEEKLTRAKREAEELEKANLQDKSARLEAVSTVASRFTAADKNARKRVRGGNVRDKNLDKQLQQAEEDLDLAEEELRDPDQMNEQQRGEELVHEVRNRATAARQEVARLRNLIQLSACSDDESGEDLRICSTQQTQADGADSQLEREMREDTEVNATELQRPQKRANERARESTSKTKQTESPNAALQVNRKRSTANILADGSAGQEQMMDFLKDQRSAQTQFEQKFFQGLDADRHLRMQEMLVGQMSPETKKVWVRDESRRLEQQRQQREELDIINMLTPKSRNKALLDRLQQKKS